MTSAKNNKPTEPAPGPPPGGLAGSDAGRGTHITNGAEASNLPPDVDTPDITNDEPSDVIKQAKRDLDEGQVDTDLRSTPGLDAERKKDLLKKTGR